MNVKTLLIICSVLADLVFTSNIFAEEQQSFIRKVIRGGFVSQSFQTRDGNYAYLNGPNITKVKDPSGKRISEAALTLVDYPYNSWYVYREIQGMAQTSNGFVLVGVVQDRYFGDTLGVVVKVNMEGRVVWSKRTAVDDFGFDSVFPTADGGFIVTGSMYDIFDPVNPVLIKFSSSGDVLWSKSVDSLSSFFLSTPSLDGGVILAADLIRVDEQSIGVNVIKMNGSGNLVWAVTLEMREFLLQSLTALSDQGYLLAGKASDPNRLLLVRLNADGTVHSKAAYSLDVPDFSVSSLAETPDGGIAIGGDIRMKTGSAYDGFLLKINNRRQLTLQKRLGFQESKETITTVIAKEDGSYLLFGSTLDGVSSYSDTLFVGLDSNGLAPGCSFSRDLSASKILFGNVNHKSLAITPNTFVVTPFLSLKVRSKRLNRNISDVCVN